MKIFPFKSFVISLCALFLSCSSDFNPTPAETLTFDVVVYGATSSGIMAAIQAKKMNKKVLLICQSSRIGGMSTNGLGNTDVGDSKTIGGLAMNFYEKIESIYNFSSPQSFLFEPKVAHSVFLDLLESNKINVVYDQKLLLDGGIKKQANKIVSIKMESGVEYYGTIFIDASYEGDLMAKSGVSYTIGREANRTYGESINGISYLDKTWNGVSVYNVENDASSGLLPYINTSIGKYGEADAKVQGYCYRLSMTNVASNRQMITKPDDYNEREYELLIRAVKANPKNPFINIAQVPNGKFDVNNQGLISFDLPEVNYTYADTDYEGRRLIEKKIETYMRGFIWTLQNSPRIQESVRKMYGAYGLSKDEFTENNFWPEQLYIREGRRMISDYVMTEKNVKGQIKVEDSVGMGSYFIDSHVVQYVASSTGTLLVEGQYMYNASSYPISYRSIVPKEKECDNLFVTCCFSASHVAYCSMRMEPVYMVLGQSAGLAAAIAINNSVSVQKVDYAKLKQELLLNKQILSL